MQQFSKPSELRERKSVTNSATGHAFEIRPVAPMELWEAGVFPQGAPGLSEQEIKALLAKESPEERSTRIAAMEAVLLTHGVTSLKIVAQVTDPENEIGIADLARDRDFLLIEVMKLSGLYSDASPKEGSFRRAGKVPATRKRASRA